MQKKSKGIALTISAALESLFVLGIIAFIYWFFLSRILDIRVSVMEATAERHAINLANVLISSEKLAYKDNGKISRGILDASKLDNVFINKNDFLADVRGSLQPKDIGIGIGYPNTLNLVEVIDLEKCKNYVTSTRPPTTVTECDGWIASLSGPVTLQDLSIPKFLDCLEQNKKIDVGSIFRGFIGGIPGVFWQPWDIGKCAQNTIPSNIKSIFTGTPISSKGLPIVIRYPDGSLHSGRMVVAVGEWT